MTPPTLERLARMDWAEIRWRSRAQAQIGLDRLRSAVVKPHWDRTALLAALAPLPELGPARLALAARRWDDAHRELVEYFATAPQRFVIGPSSRTLLTSEIRRHFPESADAAATRADRILGGEYDLLGYRGLRFSSNSALPAPPALPALPALLAPDWHSDPVHGRSAPRDFWSSIRYLDPACGDHKIVWELNRHQHWLALGRAFWLTGEAKYRNRYLAELASWLEANSPGIGINWASMLELALRSLSWLWALNFFNDPGRRDDAPWTVDLLVALDRQLTQIERNLSYYFSPNTHLLGEALALYVAGRSLPGLKASARRAATGRRVLVGEIARQIAPDGGHCERSTHYQRYTLDFYSLALAVARITGDPVSATFERAVAQLASAARALCDDEGRFPLIGDDDGGQLSPILGRAPDDIRDTLTIAAALAGREELAVGPPPEEAFWLLAHPALSPLLETLQSAQAAAPPGSTALPDSGYYVSRSAAGDHIVIDGGPHGFLNGGHAHADALSLTMTVRGVPLLLDPGTGCYTIDSELRDRMRSTALHNTLVLDGRSQSIPGGPFSWARTANTRVLHWETHHSFDYFVGAHDGYHPAEHRRHVLVRHGDLVIVADLVRGAGFHSAAVHWHIDPQWAVEIHGRRALLSSGAGRVDLAVATGHMDRLRADVATGLGWYSPAYGRVDPATTIRISRESAETTWIVTVFGLDMRNPVLDVDIVPVWAEAGVLAESTAVRIARGDSIDYFLVADPDARGETCPPVVSGSSGREQPPSSGIWRVADIETNARALLCRLKTNKPVTLLASVDGSIVRSSVGWVTSDPTALPVGPQGPAVREPACVESPAS